MARPGGVLLPPGVGSPLSLVGLGEKEGGEREEGKAGRGLPWPPLSLSPLWPIKAHTITGGFR